MIENIMWVNLLFCFTVFVQFLFLLWNIKSIKNMYYRSAMGFFIGLSIVGNLFSLWHTWGEIAVHGLTPREVFMYWLAYPEYSLTIQVGILALAYMMVPHKNLKFRGLVATNLVFLVALAFQLRILIKGLPMNTPLEFLNVCYQAQHAAFVGSVIVLMGMLLQEIKLVVGSW